MSHLTVTEPIIRARLDRAVDKQYHRGVLGLRAQPHWDSGTFDHKGVPVTVVPCPSVLAIWEAIETRDPNGWTVVLTDVDDDDLGDTVLAHLLDGRLITPDPWDAVRGNFSATTIEPALYRGVDNDRAVANGLLDVLSPDSYTPAPGGVLTRDHAMTTVARDVLKIVRDPGVEVDQLAILEWSRTADASVHLADLKARGTAELFQATTAWLAGRAGLLAEPLSALLASGRIGDLVPLGIVAGLFCQDKPADPKGLGLFLGHYGLAGLNGEVLNVWYTSTRGLVTSALKDPHTVLATAASIADQLQIGAAAAASDLLPQGLDARISALADALDEALPRALPADLDSALINAAGLARIEALWAEVEAHFLAAGSHTVDAFSGAVRLARWLAAPAGAANGLAEATASYLACDSWVDTALVKVRRGAEQPKAAAALRAVIDTTLARRSRHDRMFAQALADAPKPPVPVVENVLRDVVVPIARQTPTLLVVIDALSVAAANDLVTAIQQSGWTEVASDGRRGGALAVLPTLTQRSRCSLLCGELREGADDAERNGFLALIRDAKLEATGGGPDPIFHKAALDAITPGAALATDVTNAVADTDHRPLVAVVLNYVDDTLHHADPGGTDWTIDTITHLRPLLSAARSAGRAVVITSDHGHLIDYGTGAKAERANTYGQRAHGDFANVDPEREIVIEGSRVLTDTHKVVLAVDPDIRYGARNAGYHGGATPAEAIVPVLVFVPGQLPAWARPVAAVEPDWWYPGTPASVPVHTPKGDAPSLFDIEEPPQRNPLPAKVIRSKVYANQFKLAGRIVITDEQIEKLLTELLAAGAHELTLAQAAAALGVATANVNGALMQVKRILDVEGYEVLAVGGGVVKLDEAALREQFGVAP